MSRGIHAIRIRIEQGEVTVKALSKSTGGTRYISGSVLGKFDEGSRKDLKSVMSGLISELLDPVAATPQ